MIVLEFEFCAEANVSVTGNPSISISPPIASTRTPPNLNRLHIKRSASEVKERRDNSRESEAEWIILFEEGD
jgi:hypothetical protein